MSRAGQAGSVSLLVVAMAGVLLMLTAALGVVSAMVHAHRVAQSAADLAALAGAQRLAAGADACTAAGRIAEANGARMSSCQVTGPDVTVEVVAPGPRWLGQVSDLAGRSRAGPG
jgi:secretion/DNA translocation related TadE-like protein